MFEAIVGVVLFLLYHTFGEMGQVVGGISDQRGLQGGGSWPEWGGGWGPLRIDVPGARSRLPASRAGAPDPACGLVEGGGGPADPSPASQVSGQGAD